MPSPRSQGMVSSLGEQITLSFACQCWKLGFGNMEVTCDMRILETSPYPKLGGGHGRVDILYCILRVFSKCLVLGEGMRVSLFYLKSNVIEHSSLCTFISWDLGRTSREMETKYLLAIVTFTWMHHFLQEQESNYLKCFLLVFFFLYSIRFSLFSISQ